MSALDSVAVLVPSGDLTWRDLRRQAAVLAAELPDGGAICHLCRSMSGFLVGLLATWSRHGAVVLPSSGGAADIASLLKAAGVTAVLTDSDGRPPGLGQTDLPILHVAPPRAAAGGAELPASAMPAPASLRITLYTSGSTGQPQGQHKTLAQLVHGADILHRRLCDETGGDSGAPNYIVSSVPPQHMFGLEAAVMLTLTQGLPIAEGRPLLPADVALSFGRFGRGGLWVATPMHLRALVRAATTLPGCAAVLVSTMALSAALAMEAEQLLGVPVLEIYGSTETGALALRRTAHEPDWTPLAGVSLVPGEHGCIATGSHFTSPSALSDQIELSVGGRFLLQGREADLIKIGGRRASLAGLNQLLDSLPGLDEGVFYCPSPAAADEADASQRLVLIHTGAPLDKPAALAWLRARLDPAFVPRAFVQVATLPRSEAGKLRRQDLDAIYQRWQAKGRQT